MISIRKATDELDRLEENLQALRESYGQAIHSTGQYAIEMEPSATNEFREHLRTLEEQLALAKEPEDWQALQAGFRSELRNYHHRTKDQLARLRQEIKAAGEAVQLFAQNVAAIGSDHEAEIKNALQKLEKIARSIDPVELQEGIRAATRIIAESVEVMRRGHQVATAQLRDEIRLLHQQIEVERNIHLLDRGTGVWNRQKLDSNIADMLQKDRAFCILVVCVQNLPRLDIRYSPAMIESALKALLLRFAGMLDPSVMIGRWDDQNFAAILEMEPRAAMGLPRIAANTLAGDYPVQERGVAQTISLQVSAGVIDRATGTDEASFQKKLSQMSHALSGS